jgi:hypothetical protein
MEAIGMMGPGVLADDMVIDALLDRAVRGDWRAVETIGLIEGPAAPSARIVDTLLPLAYHKDGRVSHRASEVLEKIAKASSSKLPIVSYLVARLAHDQDALTTINILLRMPAEDLGSEGLIAALLELLFSDDENIADAAMHLLRSTKPKAGERKDIISTLMLYVEMGPEWTYMEKARKTIDMARGVHRNPTTFGQLIDAFREGNVVGAYALLNMDLSHRELSEIIDNLVAKARKNDWKAVHAIAEYGKRASRPDVIELLKHAALFGDARMSRHARRALAMLGTEAELQACRPGNLGIQRQERSIVPIERRLLKDYKSRVLKEDQLAETAAKTLGAFVTADNADEIILKLCDMAREGNECAAFALGACAEFSGRNREALLTLVGMVLTDDGDATWAAMKALKRIGPDGAWPTEIADVVLEKLFDDRDGSRALLALWEIGPHVFLCPGSQTPS